MTVWMWEKERWNRRTERRQMGGEDRSIMYYPGVRVEGG
jgi:hypothetical protein